MEEGKIIKGLDEDGNAYKRWKLPVLSYEEFQEKFHEYLYALELAPYYDWDDNERMKRVKYLQEVVESLLRGYK